MFEISRFGQIKRARVSGSQLHPHGHSHQHLPHLLRAGVRAVCDVMRVCTVQVEDIVPGVEVNVQNTEQEQLVKKIAAPPRGHSLNRMST